MCAIVNNYWQYIEPEFGRATSNDDDQRLDYPFFVVLLPA